MGDPLVTVIIPVFNAGRFLRQSILSVLEQDYRPLEIVLVDDGSTDDSLAVAQALAAGHQELRVLRHPENVGPAAARNAAMAAAGGDLITFLDADDWMAPARLSFQAAYLASRPDVDVVIGRQEIVLEAGAALPGWLRQPPERQPSHYPMSLMVPRALFARVGVFDARLRVGSDADWLFRATAAKAVIDLVDRLMVYRRIHGANLTYRAAELRAALLCSVRNRLAARREAP